MCLDSSRVARIQLTSLSIQELAEKKATSGSVEVCLIVPGRNLGFACAI